MKKYILIIIILFLFHCSKNKIKQDVNLIVLNQSSEMNLDINLFIDDELLFSEKFTKYKDDFEPPIKEKKLKLEKGQYEFFAYSKIAKIKFKKNIDVKNNCWVVIVFWYETGLGLYPKPMFTIELFNNKPIFL